MKIGEEKKKHLALPGEPISAQEFKKGIKAAEQGPFHSIKKTKKIISQWRKLSNGM